MLHVLIQLGSDRYAIPARDIVEVLPLVALRSLPGAPRSVAGLLDYHGAGLPVVDLSELVLGRPAAPRVSTRLLIVRHSSPNGGELLVGLLVERTTGMIRREPRDFRPTNVAGARYLGPVLHEGDGFVQRIEVSALIVDELHAVLFPEPLAISR